MPLALRHCLVALLCIGLSACALFPQRDPLTINLVGIEPLPAQELEIRFAVKLRVQNPNAEAIDYNGVALNLDVNGQPLAAGVSNQQGRIEGFSEGLLRVPVSVSAFSALRQAAGLSATQSLNGLPYKVRGKLAGGWLGTVRFSDSGKLNLSAAAGY